MTFGEKLRELRRQAGLTQRDLAEKVGLDFSYISKVENDRNPPPAADTIVKICEALEMPAESLLALKGQIPSDVAEGISSNVVAQQFLRETHRLGLSEKEWQYLRAEVKRLRARRR